MHVSKLWASWQSNSWDDSKAKTANNSISLQLMVMKQNTTRQNHRCHISTVWRLWCLYFDAYFKNPHKPFTSYTHSAQTVVKWGIICVFVQRIRKARNIVVIAFYCFLQNVCNVMVRAQLLFIRLKNTATELALSLAMDSCKKRCNAAELETLFFIFHALLYRSPMMNWRAVHDVPRISPNVSWD